MPAPWVRPSSFPIHRSTAGTSPTPAGRTAPAPSSDHWRVSLRSERVLILGVILAVVGVGCATGGQLGAKALSQQSKSIQSEAAEGALLAQDAAAGKTTQIYTREHASDLYRIAVQTEISLKAAHTAPALEPELRKLAVLAAQVGADLDRLSSASKDEERALARELQAAANASQRIGEEL